MSVRPAVLLLGGVLVATVVAGCAGAAGAAGAPDRPPEVTGTVARAGDPGGPVLADPSDGYYEGMSLLRDDPVVLSGDGRTLDPSDLGDGDPVEVWVGDACAESFPVQCSIEAIRVSSPGS